MRRGDALEVLGGDLIPDKHTKEINTDARD
jgi:hypothetical protein